MKPGSMRVWKVRLQRHGLPQAKLLLRDPLSPELGWRVMEGPGCRFYCHTGTRATVLATDEGRELAPQLRV